MSMRDKRRRASRPDVAERLERVSEQTALVLDDVSGGGEMVLELMVRHIYMNRPKPPAKAPAWR